VWHVGLRDSSFLERLCEIDHDLAEQARARGCPCGGVLHRADYARKPRGAPSDVPADLDRRHSFCCARDGCRLNKNGRAGFYREWAIARSDWPDLLGNSSTPADQPAESEYAGTSLPSLCRHQVEGLRARLRPHLPREARDG